MGFKEPLVHTSYDGIVQRWVRAQDDNCVLSEASGSAYHDFPGFLALLKTAER